MAHARGNNKVVTGIKIETTPLRPAQLNVWLARLGPFIGLILVIAVFALLTESPGRYLSPFNLRIVLAQTVIVALGMLGIARGVGKWIAGQQTVNVPQPWVNELAITFPKPSWLLLAPGVWIALVLSILT